MRIYELGARVQGDGGELRARLTQLIVEPDTRTVSHAVVYSPDDGRARLVPLGMTRLTARGLRLTCSAQRFEEMASPVSVSLVDRSAEDGSATRLAWWPLSAAQSETENASGTYTVEADERLPGGAMPVTQKEPVVATDGKEVGFVHGVVLADDGDTVTHLVLEEKHVWQRKLRAVPVEAVERMTRKSIRLGWSREAVEDLPEFTPGPEPEPEPRPELKPKLKPELKPELETELETESKPEGVIDA